MSDFKPLGPEDKMIVPEGYHEISDLSPYADQSVDSKGKPAGEDYEGRKYVVVGAAEKKFSGAALFGRGMVGVLIAVSIICIPLFAIKGVRELFSDRIIIRWGIPQEPSLPDEEKKKSSPPVDTTVQPPPQQPVPPEVPPAKPGITVEGLLAALKKVKETLKFKPIEPPPGILNEGNNCYMNSSIQALLQIPSFKERILSANDVSADYVGGEKQKRAERVLTAMKAVVNAWNAKEGAEELKAKVDLLRNRLYQLCSDSGTYLGTDKHFFSKDSNGQYNELSQCDAASFIRIIANIIGYEWLASYEEEVIDPKGLIPKESVPNSKRNEDHSVLGPAPLAKVQREGKTVINLQNSINNTLVRVIGNDPKQRLDIVSTTHLQGEGPDHIIVELGRFVDLDHGKDTTPLVLPENDRVEVDGKPYTVVGYVKHEGAQDKKGKKSSPFAGHYITEFKVGDQWFNLNDSRVTPISTRDRKPDDATIVILKKLPQPSE